MAAIYTEKRQPRAEKYVEKKRRKKVSKKMCLTEVKLRVAHIACQSVWFCKLFKASIGKTKLTDVIKNDVHVQLYNG